MNTTSFSGTSDLNSSETAAVSDFVRAVNGGERELLAGLFAADAHVNDQLRNFWGVDAISGWLDQEIVGEHVTLHVRRISKHYDVVILDAEMGGDFAAAVPKPLLMDLYFTVHGAKIARLLILLARHDVLEPEVRRSL